MFMTFCGGPVDSSLIHAIENSHGNGWPTVKLALTPEAAFALLRDAAGDGNLQADSVARVDVAASFCAQVNSPSAPWLITRRALRVGGVLVGHLLYGGTPHGCELRVHGEDAPGLVLHDGDRASSLTPAPVAPQPPSLGVWVLKRAAEAPGVEFRSIEIDEHSNVIAPVLPEAMQLRITDQLPPAEWDCASDFAEWFDTLSAQQQSEWLIALNASVMNAHATTMEVCFALQAAHVALASLPPGDGASMFETPCLALARQDNDIVSARSSLLRVAQAALALSPTDADAMSGGWNAGETPPVAWSQVGNALRVRLPLADRSAFISTLQQRSARLSHNGDADACDGDDTAAGMLALVATLTWLLGGQLSGGSPPSSFIECLAATWRALGRLPMNGHAMLRAQIVTAWRSALRCASDADLLAVMTSKACDLQQRRLQAASGSPPRPESSNISVARGKAVFRGTVHSAWAEGGGVQGEALVFNFRVETAIEVNDPHGSAAFGVRFDSTAMATGNSFDAVLEGDCVEADTVTIDAKGARAAGVRVVRRSMVQRSHEVPRRSVRTQYGGRNTDDIIFGASAAAAAAAAPTLPGWVQAEGLNHDGTPLWAGPCSACSVLCTVPFRPRQPIGCAVSSPPLCRQCRTTQLASQAAQTAAAVAAISGHAAAGGSYLHNARGSYYTAPAPSHSSRADGMMLMSSGRGGDVDWRGLDLSSVGSQRSHLAPRKTGVVKFFKVDAGFGFIQPLNGTCEVDIFVHVTQAPMPYNADQPVLFPGQVVEYTEAVACGKRQAMALTLLGTIPGMAPAPYTSVQETDVRRNSVDNSALSLLPPVLFPDLGCDSSSSPGEEEENIGAGGRFNQQHCAFNEQARHVPTGGGVAFGAVAYDSAASSGMPRRSQSFDGGGDCAPAEAPNVRPLRTNNFFFNGGNLW